ncbi:MAG: hypothetical protein ACI4ON_04280 [Clostridia bacterium]
MEKIKNKKIMFIILITLVIILSISLVLVLLFKDGETSDIGTNNKGKDNMFTKNDIKITKTEEAELKLEDYSNSVFSMKKPNGWEVDASGVGMYYVIRVYDKNNSNNQIFLQLKMQPLLKSENGKQFWKEYASLGNAEAWKMFTQAVVLSNPTTEGFYQKFNEIVAYEKSFGELAGANFPTFSNFTKVEEAESNTSMKSLALDSKVLRGTFTGDTGKEGEGLFLASIVNFGNLYYGNIDYSYYMVYDIMAITADKDNFINYKDILSESINSIEFSDSYVKQTIDDGNAQTQQALAINAQVQQAYDSYNSAWENRQKSYDIISQKQSDATLGYERVYDTDTGEIYKAYNGFTDDYTGERYQIVTDNMYTEKVTGYIEK